MGVKGQATRVAELSKSQEAYELIRSRIASQEFEAGHRLVLAQLASALGMSVVPVREAIRRLEAEGIVVYEKNVGARVALISHEHYRQTMQALGIVEGAATALAAPHISRKQIAEARDLNTRISGALERFDAAEYAQLNHEFHALLYRDCPNHYLTDMVKEGWAKLGMVRDPSGVFTLERARASVTEHERILHLIEMQAPPAEIEEWVRNHRLATWESVLSHATTT